MNNKKILIAEDDEFLIKVMNNRLKKEGFHVDTANDGLSALEQITKNNYQVVLLDLIMPNMDGFEVLTELKKLKNQTPVLVFSNLSQEEDRKEVIELGAKGYYIKSDISIHDIVEVIKKATNQ